MEELQKHTETAGQRFGRTFLLRIVKPVLWIAGIWAALLLILQITLSPAVTGRIIDRFAAEYIDGELKFEKVRIDMFRHFPNVGISMENGSLTYPAERFDDLEVRGAQGVLLYHGCGDSVDTLASFRHFSAGIDIAALAAGKISIPHVSMSKPRIFAHSYDRDNANWNIFKSSGKGGEGEDAGGTEGGLPHIAVGRVRLTEHPHIVYTDSQDTLFAIVDVKKLAFDGRLDTKKAFRNRIGLTFDSMMVAGRLAADTIGMRMDKLHIHEHNDHMDIHAKASILAATRAFGRIHVPVSLKGTAAVHRDREPAIIKNGFTGEVATVPVGFDLTLKKSEGKMHLDSRFHIDGCRVEGIIDGFLKNIIPETEQIRTDAAISLSGTCAGVLGNGGLPGLDVVLTVPESSVSHRDIRHDVHLALKANVRTDGEGRLNVLIDSVKVGTYGLKLAANAGISDILGDDPLINMDGRFKASADSLLTFLPDYSGITADGELSADLKGSIRVSQMDIYNFGKAELVGKVSSDKLIIHSPEDTIDIAIDGLSVNIGPETKTSVKNPGLTVRLLGISGGMAKADISLKDAISVKSEQLTFSAKNAADALAGDTSRVHPLGGYVRAKKLALKDSKGMSVSLDNTLNSFQMIPKEGHQEIPVISLTSRNKRIYLRNSSNRLILTDADIKAGAAINSVERRQRRKAFQDSLASAYPDIERDSLMAHFRSMRQSRPVPEWMTEEDFKSKDINFSLDGIVAEYFRNWDMHGDIDVRTGIIMSPRLPLRNIIKGLDLSFNNDQIKVDSFRVVSGNSEIMAKGAVKDLRRALLGRGGYKLQMELSSGRMDANELLAAINAGASADLARDEGKLAEASDSEFLQMVVADSLDTENVRALVIIPADLNAEIKINAGNIAFSDLLINEMSADIVMKERCMQIASSKVRTNIGEGEFEGFYSTRTKKNIKTGFNLNLSNVTSEKVIAMMPAIDSLMPLLKSFKGQIDCELAATADLDTCMNAIMPSINGVIRIGGEDLTMSENEVFRKLAQRLKFKNQKEGRINKMTVEGLIKDNIIEVFPFILELDRYTLALSGLHNLDMSYRYHASLIRSPMLFKIGVDIYGPDFNNMKFKIGKAKYKTTDVPVFTAVIDQTRINLAESIHSIFEKGVEMAVRENEQQKAITDHKASIGYVNAAEQQIEELSDEEKRQLEEQEQE